ncbi:hypothetical protein BJX63DRAFT_433445 [Aspergillus granulosus]|uniref:Uncharacterized protein n=1 Tax=Aspergillus granulosus TaxID=176169 RepID=A0ABR4H7Q8_9EURO
MWFAVLLVAAANAVSLSAPTATLVRDIKASAGLKHPEPTHAPDDLNLLDRRDTVAQADATVCGYYTRDADTRLYCLNDNACVFYAPDSEFPGMVGCCPTTSATSGTNECIIFSTCIDISDIRATSELLEQTTDSMALFCTYDGNQYCHTRTWPGLNVADFGCTSTSSSWLETMYTYGTETSEDDDDLTTETLSLSWISESDLPTARSAPATTTTETETSTSETTTSQTQTSSPVDDEGASVTGESDDSGSSTPVGAIVGGVVGGVGGLALIAGALFLFRRHKKKSAVDPPVIPPPETKQQPGIPTKEMFAAPQGAPQGADMTGRHEVMAEPMYAELPVQESREARVVRHELE